MLQQIRPTRAEIDIAALRQNFQALVKKSQPAQLLVVVKANAYGHGAVQVAKTLSEEGAAWFGVALIEEAIELRQAGVQGEIVVFGGSYHGGYPLLIEHQLTPFIFTIEQFSQLSRAARDRRTEAKAHLKIDTGMGRIGVRWDCLNRFFEEVQSIEDYPRLRLEGIASHFANADLADPTLSKLQLERFVDANKVMSLHGHTTVWRHLANSAAVASLPETHDGVFFNLVRPGLMLYGVSAAARLQHELTLHPVLTWKTDISYLKSVPEGTPVSYAGQWVSSRPSVIATLPVGYADGYSRLNSNRSSVLVRGQRVPLVGRVCMDMCMVDVTDVPGVALHDEVVLLGEQGHSERTEKISVEELALHSQTIPYEILCSLSSRVPRTLRTTQ